MKPLLGQIAEKKIKIVTNAGGINVEACRAALESLCSKAGILLKIGIVQGDDLLPRAAEFAKVKEMFTEAPFPPLSSVTSVNAYLGAGPIAACLSEGCDIVITGRVVDSALVLGPLVHEFGWKLHPSCSQPELDLLAAGTLVGHVLECGAQSTGGLFTDSLELGIDSGWWNIGYPVAEVLGSTGEFTLTKPESTGGLISVGSVSEQILYEIGDPSAYIVPDVVCDFSNVHVEQIGENRVRVSGALGRSVPSQFKVCATYKDGFKMSVMILVTGLSAADAKAKCVATGNALVKRVERAVGSKIDRVNFEFFGTQKMILKITLKSGNLKLLTLFAAECASPATSMAPGTTFMNGGKPRAVELVRLFCFLLDKREVVAMVEVGGRIREMREEIGEIGAVSGGLTTPPRLVSRLQKNIPNPGIHTTPLSWLCYARSGDKGNNINLALIARHPSLYPILLRAVLPGQILDHFAEQMPTGCEKFQVPGLHSVNFLLHNCLDGGGMASLMTDSLGKGFGQMVLGMQIGLTREEIAVLARVDFRTKSMRYEHSMGVSRVTLCKGHNPLTNALVADLTRVVSILELATPEVRALIIQAEGKSFCAGADLLASVRSEFKNDPDLNELNAFKFASLFARLNRLPQCVIAVVGGNCLGGGLGLVSCSDWVVATEGAIFGLPELKIGMVPATIFPFVKARIGEAAFRRLSVLGANVTDLAEAKTSGLVDQVTDDPEAAVQAILSRVRLTSPLALQTLKRDLLPLSAGGLARATADILAKVRVTDEVAEGVDAMKSRRVPRWARL